MPNGLAGYQIEAVPFCPIRKRFEQRFSPPA
jgi:hypothetical protein